MKKLFLFSFFLFSAYSLQAAVPVAETPVLGSGTPVTIAISSNTLTKVPSSQTSGRFGIWITNPDTNSHPVVGFYGDCSSTSLASTIRPITISTTTANNNRYFSMREDVCLWLISLRTASASQNIHYQEINQ